MATRTFEILTDLNEVSAGIKFIQATLKDFKLRNKKIISTMLTAEEMMIKFIENKTDTSSKLKIALTKTLLGAIEIMITCKGKKIDFSNTKINLADVDNRSSEDSIRNHVLSSFSDSINVLNQNGENMGLIIVKELQNVSVVMIFVFLIVLCILGFCLKDFIAELISNTNESVKNEVLNNSNLQIK